MQEFMVRIGDAHSSETGALGYRMPNDITVLHIKDPRLAPVPLMAFLTFDNMLAFVKAHAENLIILDKPAFPLVAAPMTTAAALELLEQMSQDAQTLRIQQSQLLNESDWDQGRYGPIADTAWQHYNTADRALHNFLQQMLHK